MNEWKSKGRKLGMRTLRFCPGKEKYRGRGITAVPKWHACISWTSSWYPRPDLPLTNLTTGIRQQLLVPKPPNYGKEQAQGGGPQLKYFQSPEGIIPQLTSSKPPTATTGQETGVYVWRGGKSVRSIWRVVEQQVVHLWMLPQVSKKISKACIRAEQAFHEVGGKK